MAKEKIKLIIWDLDNTIWDGVLSENDNVVLKDCIGEVLEILDNRGIINSIASKNNYDDAMAKLREFGIDQYFLCPMINWNSKGLNVAEIIKEINILANNVAFVDDQEFERDEVLFNNSGIVTIDASRMIDIPKMEEMKPLYVTKDSKLRRIMYQCDIERKNSEENYQGSKEEFLRSLNMEINIRFATVQDLYRVEELTVRTHQLNSTGYTYSCEELERLINDEDHDLYVVDLKDKFGAYGSIGIILVKKQKDQWVLKLLLTSCRVMSRGIGTVLLSYIINKSKDLKVKLYAEFVPTDKNRIMVITYSMMGFHRTEARDSLQILQYTREEKAEMPDYIKITE